MKKGKDKEKNQLISINFPIPYDDAKNHMIFSGLFLSEILKLNLNKENNKDIKKKAFTILGKIYKNDSLDELYISAIVAMNILSHLDEIFSDLELYDIENLNEQIH